MATWTLNEADAAYTEETGTYSLSRRKDRRFDVLHATEGKVSTKRMTLGEAKAFAEFRLNNPISEIDPMESVSSPMLSAAEAMATEEGYDKLATGYIGTQTSRFGEETDPLRPETSPATESEGEDSSDPSKLSRATSGSQTQSLPIGSDELDGVLLTPTQNALVQQAAQQQYEFPPNGTGKSADMNVLVFAVDENLNIAGIIDEGSVEAPEVCPCGSGLNPINLGSDTEPEYGCDSCGGGCNTSVFGPTVSEAMMAAESRTKPAKIVSAASEPEKQAESPEASTNAGESNLATATLPAKEPKQRGKPKSLRGGTEGSTPVQVPAEKPPEDARLIAVKKELAKGHSEEALAAATVWAVEITGVAMAHLFEPDWEKLLARRLGELKVRTDEITRRVAHKAVELWKEEEAARRELIRQHNASPKKAFMVIVRDDLEFDPSLKIPNAPAVNGRQKVKEETATEKPTKAPKQPKEKSGVDSFGSRIGTDCAKINQLLSTIPQTERHLRKTAGVSSSVEYHLDKLVRLELLLWKEEGGYYLPETKPE